MPVVKPPMRSYKAEFKRPGTQDSDVQSTDIRAAYFVAEAGFTVFKNDEHQAVFAVRDDCLLTVERTTD
jgi:hypothetical protein